MFEAKINVDMLIECIESIAAITDEAMLNIAADGWKVNAVEPANVAMVSFELQSDIFDKFEFGVEEEEDTIKIGLDFGNLLGMLRIWESKEVELKLDENAEKLFVRSGIFDYSMSLIKRSSLRRVPEEVPEVHFPAQAIIEKEDFVRTIRAMERVDEHVILGVEAEEFYMETEGERDTLRSVLGEHSTLKKKLGNLRSLYSLDFLSEMTKGMTYPGNLTLSFGNDYPLQIDFNVAHGKGKVTYFLAPRIESND